MANESGENISAIVNNIACELAKKKLNFKEDDKEDQSRLEQLSLEISEQQEEVQESIDGIYNTIKAQYFGIVLPKGLKHEVAEYVLLQVNEKDLYSASEIEVGDATVKEILVGALQKTDEVKEYRTSNNNISENFDFLKNESNTDDKINELILENERLENQIAPQAFSKAHIDNATQNDKDLAVVMMRISELDNFISMGIKFDALESFDKKSVVKSIIVLQSCNSQLAQNYMKAFEITQEILENEEYSDIEMVLDTDTAEMDETTREINIVANKVKSFIKYYDNISDDRRKTYFEEMIETINNSNYPIDGILEAFAEVGENIETDNPDYFNLLEMLKGKLKDENNGLVIDGYVTKNYIAFLKKLSSKDKKLTGEFVDLFNNRIDKKDPHISIEMINVLNDNDIFNIPDEGQLEDSGTEFVIKELFKKRVSNEIQKKNPVDENLINSLVMGNSQIAKAVLSENLLNQRNQDSFRGDTLLDMYIHAFQNAIRLDAQGTTKNILDSDKTNLGKISEGIQELIPRNVTENQMNIGVIPDEEEIR